AMQLFHMPAAHSDADAIVHFRTADVHVIGDLVDLRRFPVIHVEQGGSITGLLAALNRLMEMAVPPMPLVWQEQRTLLVPGHGRIMDEADLVEYRDMVTIVRDRIQHAIEKGLTLEQVHAANPTAGFRARYGAETGDWTTARFVEAVYRSLKGKS
ncbi:MAG: MBL fold metallo-hydrolase, partial [Vicinamibacterales bacterium]